MREYLPFVIVGLTTGGVYALASMGLVLTYATSGVFNFAHGAVAMFATFLFYTLRVDVGLPTAVAAAVAVLGFAPLLGIVIDRLLLRRLEGSPTSTFVVASLGLLVALQGLAVVVYGAEERTVAPIFPTGTYRLPGVFVGIDQTIVVAIAVVAGIGLAAFFRKTHLGLQMRAVVGDRNLTELVGADSSMVTTFSWMLGCAFAALSGILFAPFVGLDSLLFTLLVVQVFGAAIIGGLRSVSLAGIGAFGIALAASLATKMVASKPDLVGLPQSIPFVVLFAVLIFSRKGAFTEVTATQVGRVEQTWRAPRFGIPLNFVVALAVAVFLPSLLPSHRLATVTTTLAYLLLFASLSLLLGMSRQVSLCHVVFVLFGATTLGQFLSVGVPYLLALPLAALVLVPVGAILAIPAIRLSGLFLALATFGFGILAQSLVFPILLGTDGAIAVPRPSFVASDRALYYFVLGVVVLGVLAVELVRRSRLGRFSRALADSVPAVESLAVNPTSTRVLVFCLSAFLAALAGGLLGTQVGRVVLSSFSPFQSLVWVTVLVLAGTQTFGGSLLAAVALVTIPAMTESATLAEWQPVMFGVGAMLLAQAPNGLAGLLRVPNLDGLVERSRWRLRTSRSAERFASVGWAKEGAV